MTPNKLRVGVVGLGYISAFHVKAILAREDAELISVCDSNISAIANFSAAHPEIATYSALEDMLTSSALDLVHVLTQPDSHTSIAVQCAAAGCNVLIEKPASSELNGISELRDVEERYGVRVAISHNFIFSRPFLELRKLIGSSRLGQIRSVRLVWKKHLAQVDTGPWGIWMLRDARNVLLETGSHVFSELLSVLDEPIVETVSATEPRTLPSGVVFYRRWQITGSSCESTFTADIDFRQGYDQHYVEVHGTFGVAIADIENDVIQLFLSTGQKYDLELLRINLRLASSRVRQSITTFVKYAASKIRNSLPGGPFETSLFNSIDNCYSYVWGENVLSGSDIAFAGQIAQLAQAASEHSMIRDEDSKKAIFRHPKVVSKPERNTRILITGATGFIGKHLLSNLQEDGESVRVIARNPSSLLDVKFNERSEILVGDYGDPSFLENALVGVEIVFHLAVAHSNSLAGYLQADFERTKRLVEASSSAGIKRFIFTGTIDSLYLGPGAGVIRESDGVDPRIDRRNNYARSKAIAETWLNELHQRTGFPVVIVRPTIVIGVGGPVEHVGVADWAGPGYCSYWGHGKHPLPFVLVEDVVTGMIKSAKTAGIAGNTYNLSSPSIISAREYVAEIENHLGVRIACKSSSALIHWLGDLFKWLVKALVKHPDSKRFPSYRDWRCREQHASFDISAARSDLEWNPTDNRETIAKRGIVDMLNQRYS